MKFNVAPLYCPACNSENITVYTEGGYRILHCGDCEEDFDLEEYESNSNEKYEDVDEEQLDSDNDIEDDYEDIDDNEKDDES